MSDAVRIASNFASLTSSNTFTTLNSFDILPQYTGIAAPNGTTHFKIESAGAEVDFENETFVIDANDTAIIAWDNTATAAITLTNTVTANSTSPLFLVMGIEFYQEVNGQMYPLKNGAFNPLALVKVSGL